MTLEAFEDHLRSTDSPRTVLAYLPDVRRFEEARAGRPLDFDLYESWVGSLSVRPQTVWRKRAAVRRWLAFLARHGDEGARGVLGVLGAGYKVARRPRERDQDRPGEVLAPDYALARENAPAWLQGLLVVLWWTGARISEVLGDELAGIPFLTVLDGQRLVTEGHVETLGKGGKRRVLVLPLGGRKDLGGWLARRLCAPSGDWTASPLFPSPQDPSRAITPQSVNEALYRAGLKCGAHAFRHAYKARLRRAGVGEEVVRALMGHGPRNTTDLYGRVSLEEMKEAVEKI